MSGATALLRLSLIGMAAGASLGLPTAYSLVSAHANRTTAAAAQVAAPDGRRDDAASGIEDEAIVDDDGAGGGIGRARDGLFYADLRVNGTPIRCLVDTGASAMVLSSTEAAQLGVHPRGGYTGRIVTAGGERAATRQRLDAVEVAGHRYTGVSAVLVRGGGTPCLMGQELLARLDAVEIHGDELSLR